MTSSNATQERVPSDFASGLTGRGPRPMETIPLQDPDLARAQSELRYLLTLIDAGFSDAPGEKRERYHAAVDRFMGTIRQLRAKRSA